MNTEWNEWGNKLSDVCDRHQKSFPWCRMMRENGRRQPGYSNKKQEKGEKSVYLKMRPIMRPPCDQGAVQVKITLGTG